MKPIYVSSVLQKVSAIATLIPIFSYSNPANCDVPKYWNGERCVNIPSGMEKLSNDETDSLICLNGFVWVESKGICITLPPNSEYDSTNIRPSFKCVDGYASDGMQCFKLPTCKENQYINQGKCSQIPKNSEKIDDTTWVCKESYYKEKLLCKSIPNGMVVDDAGNLLCAEGYFKSKKSCIPLPENSTLIGNDSWQCNDGFYKDGLKCFEIPEHGYIGNLGKLRCDVGYMIKQRSCIADQDRFVFGFVIGGIRDLYGCDESENTMYYQKNGETVYIRSPERYNVKQTPQAVVKYSVRCLADSGWATNTIEEIEAYYKNDTLFSLHVVAPAEHKEFVKKKLNARYKKISETKSTSFDGSVTTFTHYKGTKYVNVSVGENWDSFWIWYSYSPIDAKLMREADALYLKGY